MSNIHNLTVDIAVIGGGPSGLAAAYSAHKNGAQSVLIIERGDKLGGILNQCIHSGFGLHNFKEELTGPEYAHKYIELVKSSKIDVMLNTMVTNLHKNREITAINEQGIYKILAKSVILSTGCRERPGGAINIFGERAVGVYTAGLAQKFCNIDGYLVGREVVILGSGDIGLIMARRMILEGAKVKAVVEIMPHSSGLARNVVQCVEDFEIPLYFNHTVTKTHGKTRLERVTVAKVDEKLNPIKGTEFDIKCDTLLLSVGLIPENELAQMAGVQLSQITNGAIVDNHFATNVEGIFACGNALHVHDLVDFVSIESEAAGKSAAEFIKSQKVHESNAKIFGENGVRYVVPHKMNSNEIAEDLTLRFRVGDVYKDCSVGVYAEENLVKTKKCMILAPGEMETIVLKSDELTNCKGFKNLTLRVEEN